LIALAVSQRFDFSKRKGVGDKTKPFAIVTVTFHFVVQMLVMPAEAGIQRLKTLDPG